ncbi:MAG TPA: hypothetical protein DEA55_02355 [Rhodospirillaceae bacterium]|nr:hypothetical protein [Rhodospirillaceae bacterium]
MADDDLQALKSFKKDFEKIWLAFNPNQTTRFSTDEPSAIDDNFLNALSSTVGMIQKRLLDHDRAFLKKFNPKNDATTETVFKRSADNISHQLGVLGLPGKDTHELVNALVKLNLLKKPGFKDEKEFLERASKLYNEFIKLPESLQMTINAELAPKPSPIIESGPPPKTDVPPKPGETSTSVAPPPPKPRPEEEVPPWLAYEVKNPFFEERDYALMLQNPRDEAALQKLARAALFRFVERAVEDGVAWEVPRPASYPKSKGVMGITTGGVTKYYDTSHISEAMFGLYKKDGKTVHFKPDYRDMELAFEGLPLKGAPLELPKTPIYREELDKTNFDNHKYGDHTFFHNRVWAHFFGEIGEFPEADRNRILYRMGQRLEGLNDRNDFFKTQTYEIELGKAQQEEKVGAFMKEMQGLALRNASPFAYYRLYTENRNDPDNLQEEYYKSQKDYIRQRQEKLYKLERGIIDAPPKKETEGDHKKEKEGDCKKAPPEKDPLSEYFNQTSFVPGAGVEIPEGAGILKTVSRADEFRMNIVTAGLALEASTTTDNPGTKSPAPKTRL